MSFAHSVAHSEVVMATGVAVSSDDGGSEARGEKNCFVWQVPSSQRLPQMYLAIWQIILHETDNDEQ